MAGEIGKKRAAQRSKVYYADSKSPDAVTEWTLDTGVRCEGIYWKSGSDPSTATIVEFNRGTAPMSIASPPGMEAATSGNGTTGNLPKGVNLTEGTLVKIELERLGATNTYDLVFMGVIVDVGYNLGSALATYQAQDYRYFLRKTPVYGRLAWCVIGTDEFGSDYIRACRTTFNEDGKPDRAQMGETFGGEGTYDSGFFIKPRYNRNDATETGAPIVSENLWADFWTLGHIWDYLRVNYCSASAPTDIAHLTVNDFIDWPASSETDTNSIYYQLHRDLDGNRNIPQDFAITGLSLAEALDQICKRCITPLDWTLTYGSDNKADIVLYDARQGRASFDLTWGAPGQNVYDVNPTVKAGTIHRSAEDRFNRAYGIGRKKVFELTLDTTDGSLVPNWNDDAQTAFIASVAGEEVHNDSFPRVFLSWRAPENLDWETLFFGAGVKTQLLDRPALKQLITTALNDADGSLSKARTKLAPQLWRSVDGGTHWKKMPSSLTLSILPDICGFTLTQNARNEKKEDADEDDGWDVGEPYTWDGDTGSPTIYSFRISIALESDQCIDRAEDLAESYRALEYFMDGGNGFRSAYHAGVLLPIDGTGNPTIDANTSPPTENTFGAAGTPVVFEDDSSKLAKAVFGRLEVRQYPNIGGALILNGCRTNPVPIGYIVGTLSGDEGRADMVINACVRSITWTREADESTLNLDGR